MSGAFEVLAIEEAAAALGATASLPATAIIGTLGLLGYASYHIQRVVRNIYNQKYSTRHISNTINEAKANPKEYQPYLDKYEKYRDEQTKKNSGIETNHPDADFESLEDQRKNKASITFPGSNHIGPQEGGENLPSKTAIDEDAKEHDIKYGKAKTGAEIQEADKITGQKAGDHLVESIHPLANPLEQAQAGTVLFGVGGKYLQQKITGNVIYPSNLSGK